MARKKPTLQELQLVTENLIMENQFLKRRIASCEIVVNEYITWKKDEQKFKKHFEKYIEDGITHRVHNDKSQSVSKRK